MKRKNPTTTNLRRLMKKHDLTQPQVADMLKISPGAVRKWTLPKSSPSHRPMPRPEWELLLLHTGEHPDYILAKKITTAEGRKK